MEVIPGYKQTEVGMIPEDWNDVPIGQLLAFKNGLNKAKRFFGTGTPIVNYMDVFQHTGLTSEKVLGKVTVTLEERRNYSAKAGDVFFTRTSETVEEIGTSSVLLEEVEGAVFSGFVLRGRPISDSLDLSFKKYCFSHENVRKQIRSSSSYTTRALTNGTLLSKVLIPLPPTKAEQEAIAETLSDVGALIKSLDQLIAKKRHLKQGAMQELLTGKTRLPGFSREWVRPAFGEVAKVRNEKINTRGKPVAEFCIELEQVGQNIGQVEGFTDARSRDASKYLFRSGDVLFGRLRPYLRKFWLADRDGVCSTEIWPLMPSGGALLGDFLHQVVQTQAFVEAASAAYGTHMPRADWSVLCKHLFDLPTDTNEQTAIAAVLSDMDAEIVALESKLAKTHQIKQGMMQELLTGKIRLL